MSAVHKPEPLGQLERVILVGAYSFLLFLSLFSRLWCCRNHLPPLGLFIC